jgi:hypothetical protein
MTEAAEVDADLRQSREQTVLARSASAGRGCRMLKKLAGATAIAGALYVAGLQPTGIGLFSLQ